MQQFTGPSTEIGILYSNRLSNRLSNMRLNWAESVAFLKKKLRIFFLLLTKNT